MTFIDHTEAQKTVSHLCEPNNNIGMRKGRFRICYLTTPDPSDDSPKDILIQEWGKASKKLLFPHV